MAKGCSCPLCNFPMRVVKEDRQPKINYVTYVCQNASCKNAKANYEIRREE